MNDDARDSAAAALFLLRLGLEQVVEHALSLTLDEKTRSHSRDSSRESYQRNGKKIKKR